MMPKDRLIVALDVDTQKKARTIAEELKDEVKFFKIGLELFSSCGPSIVSEIKKEDSEIFLDLKFHDIPNTAARAARAVARLGVYMFNVHALGGYEMMKASADAARNEAQRLKIDAPKILAVTILTSMDEDALKKVGLDGKISDEVLKLAGLACEAGLDGVVASAREAKDIRKALGGDFLIVTPGVRPHQAASGDQKRTATPRQAIEDGADFIVVGRPVTEAKDMCAAAKAILKEIS